MSTPAWVVEVLAEATGDLRTLRRLERAGLRPYPKASAEDRPKGVDNGRGL